MKRDPRQISLLDLVPTVQRRRASVGPGTYAAIIALRASGYPVHAQGNQHNLGGVLMSDRELRLFARATLGERG